MAIAIKPDLIVLDVMMETFTISSTATLPDSSENFSFPTLTSRLSAPESLDSSSGLN